MIICPNCEFEHPQDVRICTRCSSPDPNTIVINHSTLKLDNISTSQTFSQTPSNILKRTRLNDLLSIRIGEDHIVIPTNKRIVLGRGMHSTDTYFAVDLTRFEGQKHGVSRCHADIQRNEHSEIILTDLGSTNGTFLAQNRLPPFQPITLQPHCIATLGGLKLTISFEIIKSSLK